jgi:hypothetical protein
MHHTNVLYQLRGEGGYKILQEIWEMQLFGIVK